MRAIDVECFAGGFTLGVAQAGFELVGKRELPGGFGVPSVAANLRLLHTSPEFSIEVGGQDEWTPYDVDLVFGNPPCSAFSGVSDKNFAGADNKINDCMWALVEYAAKCNPDVVVYESVQNAYGKGLPLLRSLHDRLNELTGERYVLHHVLHNARALGGCAERRRYFWVASRIPIGFASPELTGDLPVLWDAISDLYDVGDVIGAPPSETTLEPQRYGSRYGAAPSEWAKPLQTASGFVDGHLALKPQYHRQSQPLLDQGLWEEGENLTKALQRYYETHGTFPTMEDERDHAFLEHYGPDDRNFNFGGAWQPERWRHGNPARVITGGSAQRSLHPFAPRPLTLREMYRIQGFTDEWLIKPAVDLANGSANVAALWPGKGIPVQSGQWIAEMAMAAIAGDPVDDGKLEQTGELEFVWNGSNDHKPAAKKAAAKKRRSPAATTKTDTTKEKHVTKASNPALDEVTLKLQTEGVATVSLAGLDGKEAKKARELLYSAAYSLDGKVKVRTDKKTQVATGVFYREGDVDPKDLVVTHGTPVNTGIEPAALDGIEVVEVAGTTSVNGQGHLPIDRPESAPMRDVSQEFIDSRDAVPAHQAAQLGPRVGDRHTWDDGTTFELRKVDGELAWVQLEPGELVFDDDGETDGVADVPVLEAETQADAQDTPGVAESEVPAVDVQGDDTAGTDAESATEDEVPEALRQPKNSAREVKDRKFDLTQLKATSHGYYVHRDYASHYFRWGWAARQIRQGDTLLEVGCGQDLPLTRVLIYYPGAEMPRAMVCVDLNKIKNHVQPKWLTVYDETNFLDAQPAIVERHGAFNVVTCFEVIEHMEKDSGVELLGRLCDSLTDDGVILLSTPVFNGKAAANHIHEWTIEELLESIEEAGLTVDERFGTFASYHDVKRGLSQWMANWRAEAAADGELDVLNGSDTVDAAAMLANQVVLDFYESLRGFYADDVLANFMAPNLPDHARNNVWRLKRAPRPDARQHIVREGSNKFTWTCDRCGFTFTRTTGDVFDTFIPQHLGTCDGTPAA